MNKNCGNTHQNRKYVIGKISLFLFSLAPKKREYLYDGYALVKVWKIFDSPCGQGLSECLKKQVDNLREQRELLIPDEIARKLKKIAPITIDQKLIRTSLRVVMKLKEKIRIKGKIDEKIHQLFEAYEEKNGRGRKVKYRRVFLFIDDLRDKG